MILSLYKSALVFGNRCLYKDQDGWSEPVNERAICLAGAHFDPFNFRPFFFLISTNKSYESQLQGIARPEPLPSPGMNTAA